MFPKALMSKFKSSIPVVAAQEHRLEAGGHGGHQAPCLRWCQGHVLDHDESAAEVGEEGAEAAPHPAHQHLLRHAGRQPPEVTGRHAGGAANQR